MIKRPCATAVPPPPRTPCFVFLRTQQSARETRRPFAQGECTKDTPDKHFGLKIFVVLALKYQADPAKNPSDEDDDDDDGERHGNHQPRRPLIARTYAAGTLSTVCGPYSRLLAKVLEQITQAARRTDLVKVGTDKILLL